MYPVFIISLSRPALGAFVQSIETRIPARVNEFFSIAIFHMMPLNCCVRQFKNPEATKRKMSQAAKRRCTPAWIKARRARATQLPIGELVSLYDAGLSQAGLAVHFKVTQKVIYGFMRRNGIKARPAHGISQPGELNGQWKGGRRWSEKGYLQIKCKGHPRASRNGGYVPAQILIMEQHLGRFLIWKGQGHPESEIVHHKNEDKSDNRIENLQLTTYQKHLSLHAALKKAGT